MKKVPIVLASTSPRRIQFMQQTQLPFQIEAPSTDESPRSREKPRALVKRLAQEKAESIQDKILALHPSGLIIAADTIVVAPLSQKILGKPRNPSEARRMLKLLSGRKHTVLTGYCLFLVSRSSRPKKCVRVISSRVTLRTLSDKIISNYIASGEPMDKAGAYGAQGLGACMIDRIEGSFSNVVGLPMGQLCQDLEKIMNTSLFSWIL